ncbi:hypothetical protein E2651_00830 [Streptomyces sp. MZ04]|nr:hypothetical protein E2651_00830 [Streptomyces sp. MZ04]
MIGPGSDGSIAPAESGSGCDAVRPCPLSPSPSPSPSPGPSPSPSPSPFDVRGQLWLSGWRPGGSSVWTADIRCEAERGS